MVEELKTFRTALDCWMVAVSPTLEKVVRAAPQMQWIELPQRMP